MKGQESRCRTWISRLAGLFDRQPVAQAGAICVRWDAARGAFEVLLIESRSTGGWGIPKGRIEPRETSREAAQREAFEEAGIVGTAIETVGSFSYRKPARPLRFNVEVHLLPVDETAAEFPEKGTRSMKWVPITVAANEVAYAGLRVLLEELPRLCLSAHSTGAELPAICHAREKRPETVRR